MQRVDLGISNLTVIQLLVDRIPKNFRIKGQILFLYLGSPGQKLNKSKTKYSIHTLFHCLAPSGLRVRPQTCCSLVEKNLMTSWVISSVIALLCHFCKIFTLYFVTIPNYTTEMSIVRLTYQQVFWFSNNSLCKYPSDQFCK